MIQIFAHITPADAPSGVLLFLAGIAVGALAMMAVRRFRAG